MSTLPPSQRAVADLLKPGDPITHNGGKMTFVVSEVRHAEKPEGWVTTVVAKLYANRHLTGGGADHFFSPVRLVSGYLVIIGGSYLAPITPEQAAAFERELGREPA
jgi:hypothetical protein